MTSDPINHDRRSMRLPGYDYSQAGIYFVTMVTHGRALLFGDVIDGKMYLNYAGRIVHWEWLRLEGRFRSIELGEFVVMPNHIHGIIAIKDARVGATRVPQISPTPDAGGEPTDAYIGADGSPLHLQNAAPRIHGPRPGSLGAIIGQFKSRVTKRLWAATGTQGFPVWQRNYYEHIIRSEDEHSQIQRYIESNSQNWLRDSEKPV